MYSSKSIRLKSVLQKKRLSKERAEAVAEALKAQGIAESRITVDYKGDTAQPFGTAEENRVTICIAE